MKKKPHAIIGATLALPLLAPAIAESTPGHAPEAAVDSGGSQVLVLTENQMDEVTAGSHPVFIGPPLRWPPHPWPWWRHRIDPIKPPPIVTTMALGEEGGGICALCPVIIVDPVTMVDPVVR